MKREDVQKQIPGITKEQLDWLMAENGTVDFYAFSFDDGTGDLSRERKDSFYWYQKVIATNGEDLR